MKRLIAALSFVALVAVMVAGAASGGGIATDGATAAATVDTGSAIVQLKGDPLSTYVKTRPAPGKKIDFNSTTVKSYRAQLAALRNDFKQWLQANAPAAKVVGQYDISLNAVAVRLNGVSLATLQSAPQVQSVQYEGLYRPLSTALDPDLPLINAFSAWSANGNSPANAGAGVKVGIVDTGIDVTHPCFSDAGYPATQQLGDTRFTNNKVIVAKVFNNQSNRFGYTAKAIQEHGTHVAGTVACNADTPAAVAGVTIPYGISGVAPRAYLGNYNVFPGNDDNARSEDILNALEAAYADGMDVVNMSLGGGASGIKDLLTMAVDDLDEANMVVAVAAGNEGPGHYTVSSPGSAARALTAGASTVPHFIGVTATGTGGPYQLAIGDFATLSSDLTAPLSLGGSALSLGCSAFSGNAFAGKIAVISRGTCTFSTKIRNAQNAGAVATIIINNVNGDPIAMGQDGTANQPTIPAYMVSILKKADIVAAAGSAANVTISATKSYIQTANSNYMAGFSSQGPTDVDFRVKPDVVAPGVNVLSSIPAGFCATPPCFAFFQGTSMATPHLAGTAALVKWQHSGWSAADIRSAVVNTAQTGVLKPYRTPVNGVPRVDDVNIVGAGLDNALGAVNATVTLDPVSLSFGAVPAIAGQTRTETIALTNRTGNALSVQVVNGYHTGSQYGVSFSASLASGVVTVTMTESKGASLGDHEATLLVKSGGTTVAHAVLYTFVKQ